MAATLAGARSILPLPETKITHVTGRKEQKSVRLASESQLQVTIPDRLVIPDRVTLPDRVTMPKRVTLPNHVTTGIFKEHDLVDSPRRIILEKTTLGLETELSMHLDTFHNNIVDIPREAYVTTRSDVMTLIEYLKPRMKKFGLKYGFKFARFVNIGSVFDETGVIGLRNVDLLVVMDKEKTVCQNNSDGYKCIALKRFKQVDGGKPDSFRFGRSNDGRYLSSIIVARNVHEIVERSLKLHPTAIVESFSPGEEYGGQIIVTLDEKYRINLIPAIYHDADESYLVTRCYAYDETPLSDCTWRICHVNKEKAIITSIGGADRGVRCRAYKLLKALVTVEPTLQGISSYHVKTVLLHTFDETVDNVPRWQRVSVESTFQRLLKDLRDYYTEKNLPNFFIPTQNLLEFMPNRLLARLGSRLNFLVANQRELLRVLRKRSVKEQKNDVHAHC